MRRDSFLGSPQGPLYYCGTDFQGRLVRFSGRYVGQCTIGIRKSVSFVDGYITVWCGLLRQKPEDIVCGLTRQFILSSAIISMRDSLFH